MHHATFSTRCLVIGLFFGSAFIAAAQSSKPGDNSATNQKATAQSSAFVPSSLISVHKLEQQIASSRARGLKEWNYSDAHLYWLRQRAYPNDTVNWKAYSAAFAHRAAMPFAKFRLAAPFNLNAVASPRWEFVGPHNLSVPYEQYFGQSAISGRVNGVAFDPLEDGVIYIATAGGGVWKWAKSKDSTWKWTPLSDNWKSLKTGGLTVSLDPAHKDVWVYAGTGDFDGGRSEYAYGIERSKNGGNDWTLIASAELKGFSIRRILIDPDSPNIVTVAAGRNASSTPDNPIPGKLFRSDDGGDSWHEILTSTIKGASPADWEDLKCGILDQQKKRWCYAVGASSNGGEVLRTQDQGKHWEKIRPPLSPGLQESLAIAPSQTQPETVYLLSGSDELILKSDDHGGQWQSITRAFPSCLNNQSDYNWSQNYYDFYIETSYNPQTHQDIIYVGLIDVAASLDGGNTWKSVGKTFQPDAIIHNDQHAMVVNPKNPNELLVGNDGGVYGVTFDPAVFAANPAAYPWSFRTDLNTDLGLTQFYRMATAPASQSILLGGAQDNGSTSTGDLKNWKDVGGGDGGFSAISTIDPATQFATSQYLSIFKTTDLWAHWDGNDVSCDTNPTDCEITYTETIGNQSVPWGGDPVSFVAPIALDPNHQNLLYAGTNYLWRRDGANWSKHLGDQLLAVRGNSTDPPQYWDTISVIGIAPSDSNRIYTGSQNGEIWMSTSAGAAGSWKRINTKSSGLPGFAVTDIVIHPANPDTILITYSGTAAKNGQPHPGHVWKCTKTSLAQLHCDNVSGSPADGLPNIPANTLVIDPRSPDSIYYVGTDVGVFVSKNGGTTWADFGNVLGLPNIQVNHLLFQQQTLLAATFGRGIWRINLAVSSAPTFPEMLIQRKVALPSSHKPNATKN